MQGSLVQDDTVSLGKLDHGGEPCHSLPWKRKNPNFHSSIIILLETKPAILTLDNLWYDGSNDAVELGKSQPLPYLIF